MIIHRLSLISRLCVCGSGSMRVPQPTLRQIWPNLTPLEASCFPLAFRGSCRGHIQPPLASVHSVVFGRRSPRSDCFKALEGLQRSQVADLVIWFSASMGVLGTEPLWITGHHITQILTISRMMSSVCNGFLVLGPVGIQQSYITVCHFKLMQGVLELSYLKGIALKRKMTLCQYAKSVLL